MSQKSVKFLDIEAAVAELRSDYDQAYSRVLDKGNFIRGEEVELFEQEFADFCGASACVGVANGLDALILILRGLGIGFGDEVIVPAHTFVATWLAVSAVGAKPVPVDISANTFNIDPNLIAGAISSKTVAIIAVHLYGQSAEMNSIQKISETHGIALIEDAAQAHGATFEKVKCGNFGVASAFSFYPGKNLGALGDGGAVVTNDLNLAEKIRILANYGCQKRYSHETLGVNSRLDELQAAFLRCKLPRIADWNEKRKKVAKKYLDGLKISGLKLPEIDHRHNPVWHLFVIEIENRDELIEHLTKSNIQTLIHYPVPPYQQNAYKDDYDSSLFETTNTICKSILSLPMGPHLNVNDQDYVISTIIEAIS